jgi:hypothetical protein
MVEAVGEGSAEKPGPPAVDFPSDFSLGGDCFSSMDKTEGITREPQAGQ